MKILSWEGMEGLVEQLQQLEQSGYAEADSH